MVLSPDAPRIKHHVQHRSKQQKAESISVVAICGLKRLPN
jgi:hypothetical protein